ncbi:hypothetical protein [Bacillus wiedmannii]|uniref:hypothetical protein n=1 Tax=Bacillus wiedmannii TaxID=1890302 RepID=UPI000CD8DECD|nr:hypothetical protein [Bacillus wiedmannii]MBG9830472.1 phage protein [Bacillus wiedmannii]MED3079157.1 hypothetical protein [Bacillus wiedmannii]UOB94156.1 phage protein [Bacillus wiedmannii]
MKLTKQEQSVVIGTFISIMGEQLVNEHINPEKLEKASLIHNEIYDNRTPKQRREAMVSLLDKTMDEILKQ